MNAVRMRISAVRRSAGLAVRRSGVPAVGVSRHDAFAGGFRAARPRPDPASGVVSRPALPERPAVTSCGASLRSFAAGESPFRARPFLRTGTIGTASRPMMASWRRRVSRAPSAFAELTRADPLCLRDPAGSPAGRTLRPSRRMHACACRAAIGAGPAFRACGPAIRHRPGSRCCRLPGFGLHAGHEGGPAGPASHLRDREPARARVLCPRHRVESPAPAGPAPPAGAGRPPSPRSGAEQACRDP